jgi:polar amino acid transport system substrate-binding protein
MKRAIALMTLLLVVGRAAAQLTIGASPGHDDTAHGQSIKDLLRAAYQMAGYTVTIVTMPGERALLAANQGVTDGDLVRIDGLQATYPNLMKVGVPLDVHHHVVFAKRQDIVLDGIASLKPYSIAYVRGFKAIERVTHGMNTQAMNDVQSAFKMLNAGRVDVVIDALEQGTPVVNALGIDGVRVLSPPLEVITLYHYVNVRHAALVPVLENALRQLKANKAGVGPSNNEK